MAKSPTSQGSWLLAVAIAIVAACSSPSDSGSAGTGGTATGTGGSSARGGSATGGTSSAGGTTSAGGSGGSSQAGGSSATGGGAGTGGASAGGSTATGGTSAMGGSTGSGGAATGGSGGTGGVGGKDGGPPDGPGATGGTTSSGGATSNGGTRATGGASGTGGVTSGGTAGTAGMSGGGSRTGGSATGGTTTGGTTGFEPCPATGPCKIMPLGDSITDGTGYAGGYRVELFAKALADKKTITFVGSLSNGPNTVSGVTFPKSHEGHFGWTIAQVDGLIPAPALGPAPHIVLLHLGTNDINQNIAAGAPDRLGGLIDQIATELPAALIVVAKIIPEPSKASAIDTFNAAIPAVVKARADAGKHVIMVDQFTGFPNSELGDGVHPNQAGYQRMAGVWYQAIKAYLH